MKVAYRQDLDLVVAGGCSTPGCDHTSHEEGMYLHARCHPHAQIEACYKDGQVLIACAVCHRPIVLIAVAEAPGS